MSSVLKTGVVAHDNACLAALNTLQGSITPSSTQAQVNAAYIAFHRAVIASCRANNNSSGMEPSLVALKGTFGLNA
jgi:hypothetical protein